ncbi:MAG: SDR family oxidoreductase [Gammaproteobacteria bacterium]|nr:SDR family oxidoreductase [Gammaproteobacteria bacterium]MBQ0773832.1 SDR family oxidoreductase [Gammaproteobacteria bacterium]
MQATTLTVPSGDINLSVKQYGQPSGKKTKPVIVLVHGYPDSSAIWDNVIPFLVKQYQVVTYDVRGAGASDVPKKISDYQLSFLMQDLHAAIDAVSPDQPVHLVGHDWGSIQSWESVTEPGAEKRIASYTTISGPCLDHVGYWFRERFGSASPAEITAAAGQLLHSWYIFLFQLPWVAPKMWQLGLGKAWPKLLENIEGISAEVNPTQTADGVLGVNLYRANMMQRVLRPRRRVAQVPVQMVVAQKDNFVTPQLLSELSHWTPKLWRREANVTHWLQHSHPEQLAQWIGEFVDHIDGAPASPTLQRAYVSETANEKCGDFARKLVVVTGAGSGIGRETALAFSAEGAEVLCVDINEAAANETVTMLPHGQGHALTVDVSNSRAMETFAKTVLRDYGVPDVVINNAGIGMAGGFLDTSVKDWQKVLGVNVWGVIHGCRLFAQQMIDAGKRGHIVNTASAAAFTPSRAYPAYATSKSAVLMLSDCLQAELAGQGIGVTAVCPGVIDTGITLATHFVGVDEQEQDKKRKATKGIYQKRAYTPDRVAQAIVNAVRENKPLAIVSPEAHGLRLLSRFAPGIMRRMARVEVAP